MQETHWTQWLAQKTYKSSFRSRKNRSSYSPLTNTAANAARLEELSPKPVDPEVMQLSPVDQAVVAEAILNPPEPNEALKEAAKEYNVPPIA